MPQQNTAEKPSAPSVTTLDTSKKNAPSTDVPIAASYNPNMMKVYALTTLNTWDLTLLSNNHHPHLLSEYLLQKLSKSHTSPPTDKIMLTEVYLDNSERWMKNTTKN